MQQESSSSDLCYVWELANATTQRSYRLFLIQMQILHDLRYLAEYRLDDSAETLGVNTMAFLNQSDSLMFFSQTKLFHRCV